MFSSAGAAEFAHEAGEGFDGFEPDDLEGSLARLVAFNRGSAKSHSGIYRDLMVRKRKTEVDDLLRDLNGPLTTLAGELIQPPPVTKPPFGL